MLRTAARPWDLCNKGTGLHSVTQLDLRQQLLHAPVPDHSTEEHVSCSEPVQGAGPRAMPREEEEGAHEKRLLRVLLPP